MEMVYRDSEGLAIFHLEDNHNLPYEVVRLHEKHGIDSGVTPRTAYDCGLGLGQYATKWEAEVRLEAYHQPLTGAVREVSRRERSMELLRKHLADEEVRVWGLITMLKALAPGNDTKVFLEHTGGGCTAVAILPKGTDAYCWVTDMDGFIMMGFYESPEDEVGVMVEPLGTQQYDMSTDEGVKAIADTMRTFYKFFKPSA